jgi:small subunit ribosomal protein S20
MPQHKSAKKRMITNLKRQARNRSDKSSLRLSLRKYREMNADDRTKASAALESTLDRAARKGLIHKNKATRLKSRLSS